LVQTAPNVTYEVKTKRGETLMIHKPQDVPDPGNIEEFRQPIVKCNIIVPEEFIGAVIKLCQERRGIQQNQEYIGAGRAMLTYNIPLAEVIYDLHDKIKNCTRGYGTLDYDMVGYEPADLCRLDIMVNGNRVDALSVVCHRADADRRGRAVAKRLKAEIERHMFEVAVQAAIGSRVIARETVPAMRKNVTAKCYGGDVSRKKKLLAKQKEGKKRMKAIGNVEISQKAFMAVLSSGDD
jgi:GTP-binding protein LepA